MESSKYIHEFRVEGDNIDSLPHILKGFEVPSIWHDSDLIHSIKNKLFYWQDEFNNQDYWFAYSLMNDSLYKFERNILKEFHKKYYPKSDLVKSQPIGFVVNINRISYDNILMDGSTCIKSSEFESSEFGRSVFRQKIGFKKRKMESADKNFVGVGIIFKKHTAFFENINSAIRWLLMVEEIHSRIFKEESSEFFHESYNEKGYNSTYAWKEDIALDVQALIKKHIAPIIRMDEIEALSLINEYDDCFSEEWEQGEQDAREASELEKDEIYDKWESGMRDEFNDETYGVRRDWTYDGDE